MVSKFFYQEQKLIILGKAQEIISNDFILTTEG